MLKAINKKYRGFLLFSFLGFSATAISAEWQKNQSIAGFDRVHLYVPTSHSIIGNGRSLLMVLHGCVQPIDNFLSANLSQAADKHGMVIAVPDAENKAGFSCWSYWQGERARNQGDYKNLMDLANTLMAESAYQIDKNQVYIAGLSSGAAFANTTACLAPDIFAGVGVSAGPSIGTSSSGALGPCEQANVRARCQAYAGQYREYFGTQIASIAMGDQDTTVNTCYNDQNAFGMAEVYGVSERSDTTTITDKDGLSAEETLWESGRVSKLWFNGVDHAWSAGSGATGSYISSNSINYADYLGQYFSKYNQRADRNQPPSIADFQLTPREAGVISVTGEVGDSDGQVVVVNVLFEGADGFSAGQSTVPDDMGIFTLNSPELPDGLYRVSVSATDNEGRDSSVMTKNQRVGPLPSAAAPELTALEVQVNQRCADVSGRVFDVNGDLHKVSVVFTNGSVDATVNQGTFTATQCDLLSDNQVATVTAIDHSSLSVAKTVNFSISTGVEADILGHIDAVRLSYVQYSTCYLEYGSSPFELLPTQVSNERCVWQDDDASCRGPEVACANDSDSEPDEACEEFSAFNYSHKQAGRAYSNGNPFLPNYFAEGSDDAMSGSTWGRTILHSKDSKQWFVGHCN